MESLNDKNNLIFTHEDYSFDFSTFYVNRYINFDNVTKSGKFKYSVDKTSYNVVIKPLDLPEKKIELFFNSIEFTLSPQNVIGEIISFNHLNLILKKYKYKDPIYKSDIDLEFKSLKNPEDIKNFSSFQSIVIQEKDDNSKFNKLYDEMEKLYGKSGIKIYEKEINLKFLSMNIEKYYTISNTVISKNNKIKIFYTGVRVTIFRAIKNFLNSSEKIYAICGPFGIGKSYTALALQKDLYLEKIDTLYINLSNEEKIIELKQTLIKEIFFLNLEKEIFNDLANTILYHEANNIWDLLFAIDDFCIKKKKNFLLILDQYKRAKDDKECLHQLKVNKIFLLSSINDKDVKDNLASQIKGNNSLKFKYIYYLTLQIDTFIMKNLGNVDDKVSKCMEDFNYLPSTNALIENKNEIHILDFYNSQYCLILKKLSKFFKNYQIDYITELYNSKKINDSKTNIIESISKDEFLNNINNIPLKFITYKATNDNRFFSLFYAFDYIKYPLGNEINFNIAKKRFSTVNAEGFLKGGEFENILFHKFIMDRPLFEIDGFIIVNKIINMELENESKNITIEDLKTKNSIYIFQSIYRGEDYDAAILYPKKKEIILIQAKYKITSSNIKFKSYYDLNKVSIITDIVNKKFKISLDKIYILYISSVDYNYSNRNTVQNLLNSHRINCIFYSIKEDYFTSNFKNILSNNFVPDQSMEIYPTADKYIEQDLKKKNNIENELFFFVKNNNNIENNFIIGQYNEFKKFLENLKISKSLKNSLGDFKTNFINEYSYFPKVFCSTYLLFFKTKDGGGIDFSKDLILVYDDNNSIVYYNIKTQQIYDNNLFKKKNEYKNYHYVLGEWKKENSINLIEESD